MNTPGTWMLLATLAAGGLSSPRSVWAADERALPEYEVKAAFVYNFTKFTEWPASSHTNAADPLLFCLVGPDPFKRHLDEMFLNKTINGHPVRIERFATLDTAAESRVAKCHLLFVGAISDDQTGRILALLGNRPILSVSEQKGFAAAGGVIELFVWKERIRFRINNDAAQRGALKISSRLLQLADIVGAKPEEDTRPQDPAKDNPQP